MTYEAPKRFTATNDITGALIKSKSDNQDAYSNGYDLLKSGASKEQPETKFPVTIKLSKNCINEVTYLASIEDMSMELFIEKLVRDSFITNFK